MSSSKSLKEASNTINSMLSKIEIIEKSEYADMALVDIQFHRTSPRKPKEWHPELLYNSRLRKSTRIVADMSNVNMHMSPVIGLIITVKLPLGDKSLEIYKKAIDANKTFKIYIPRDRKIKILFDENLKEAIKAKKHLELEKYKTMEMYGELYNIDIKEGSLIITLTVRS